MIKYHYGVYVDSNLPITGVMRHNQAIFDAMYDNDSIDLTWEDHKLECEDYLNNGYCNCMLENGTMLIGSWILDSDLEYSPDLSGEYAAIVGEMYTQVVFSRYMTRCALCSPCYPGQGDLDSKSNYLSYDLPPDMQEEPTLIACMGLSLHTDLGLGI